jgi:uncharacterized protein
MEPTDLVWWQWGLAALAAVLIGIAKTGVPGLGILVVVLMASIVPGKQSVGLVLPLLIVADGIAVAWYRRHAQWTQLAALAPSVIVGVLVGGGVLWAIDRWGMDQGGFRPLIGAVVLTMLTLHLVRERLGDRLVPHDRITVNLTGACSGGATTLANAAGPIMNLYLAGRGMKKEAFLGTMAWFFLLLNLSKVPIFIALSVCAPRDPMISVGSLSIDLMLMPGVVLGAWCGRGLLRRIPQRIFLRMVIALAAASAVKLLLSPWAG